MHVLVDLDRFDQPMRLRRLIGLRVVPVCAWRCQQCPLICPLFIPLLWTPLQLEYRRSLRPPLMFSSLCLVVAVTFTFEGVVAAAHDHLNHHHSHPQGALPDRWYQDDDHPAHSLFKRGPADGVTYAPIGSPGEINRRVIHFNL